MLHIITINDSNNYGNRLQNFALQSLLKNQGEDVCTDHVYLSSALAFGRQFARMKHGLAPLKHLARETLDCGGAGVRRRISFESFERRRVLHGPSLFSDEKSQPTIDGTVVLGSDQIWNYRWISRSDLNVRMGMLDKTGGLITYAASIGLDDIDEEWSPQFRAGWSQIPYISVREDRAAELVREIAGRDAVVVLDPTLMLTHRQWAEIFTGCVSEDDRYVLTYFLGRPSDTQEEMIRSVARSLDAGIRRINDKRDLRTYAAGPAEFVELFSNAQYVFTDSYHACCFSVLFNKPFKVFDRVGFGGEASMNSRMRTLFRLFELDDIMGDEKSLLKYDWPRINTLLDLHRGKSLAWLEGALAGGAANA